MSVITELQEQLETTQTAAFVTTMLRDISANRLQAIRSVFEANQEYFSQLHHLTALVTEYAKRQSIPLPQQNEGGTVFIAVTSNKRFYGNLNRHVMERFSEVVKVHNAKGVVIGTTGGQYVEQHEMPQVVATIAFAKDEPNMQELHSVIKAVAAYDSIKVVHPTFINSFRQEATVTDLAHATAEVVAHTAAATPDIEYIYEPEIAEMYTFFQTQIRAVLLTRTLLETRLALTAARLMKMQRARERATEQVKHERRNIHREITTIKNLRLLETFAGFTSDRSI